MKDYLTSSELFESLKEIIDFPDSVISLQITMETGNLATIDLERYVQPSEQTGTYMDLVEEKYKLVKDDKFKMRDNRLKMEKI
jgi:hypothetical protein